MVNPSNLFGLKRTTIFVLLMASITMFSQINSGDYNLALIHLIKDYKQVEFKDVQNLKVLERSEEGSYFLEFYSGDGFLEESLEIPISNVKGKVWVYGDINNDKKEDVIIKALCYTQDWNYDWWEEFVIVTENSNYRIIPDPMELNDDLHQRWIFPEKIENGIIYCKSYCLAEDDHRNRPSLTYLSTFKLSGNSLINQSNQIIKSEDDFPGIKGRILGETYPVKSEFGTVGGRDGIISIKTTKNDIIYEVSFQKKLDDFDWWSIRFAVSGLRKDIEGFYNITLAEYSKSWLYGDLYRYIDSLSYSNTLGNVLYLYEVKPGYTEPSYNNEDYTITFSIISGKLKQEYEEAKRNFMKNDF